MARAVRPCRVSCLDCGSFCRSGGELRSGMAQGQRQGERDWQACSAMGLQYVLIISCSVPDRAMGPVERRYAN